MKLTDDQILSQIDVLERQAVGYYTGEVAAEQALALNYYLGRPFGTEEEGRSRVVSTDVWDVVEGMTPMVLKPFVSSDDVVKFTPLGQDDEETSEQESDYINWVVTQRNDSFIQLVAWVKTGLLQKNGVVKYWWEKSEQASIERYDGLSDDVFAAIAQEPGVEVVEHTEGQNEFGEPVHDVVLRITETVGHARYCVIPPEEFLISKDATSPNPQEARFVQHRRKVTIGELRAMGYDVEDTLSDGNGDDNLMTAQYQARRTETEYQGSDEGLDPASREVTLKETYLRIDANGDGMPELLKVCSVGRETLAREETEETPFCAWTPYQQPFRFYGRCPADETIEIQLIKSTLWRQSLDNIYSINNNRVYANETVNLDDLIDNQIAGVVRVKGAGPVGNAVQSAQITPIGGVVQPMMEYLDSAKENRTGYTRYNQGTDGEGLNKTATGIRLIKESANGRIEIIARAFAEQGLAPLMRGIHGLCRRHATKAETVRLRGKWAEIDPRGWKRRIDMSVAVGLGTTDQQMRLAGIQMLMGEQKQLAQAGLVTPANFYASASKLAEIVGFKNPDQFFSMPEQQQGLDPKVQQAMQAATQEIQQLQQALSEAQSGIAAEQLKGQNAQQLEAMKGQIALAMQAQKDQASQALQAQKDEAAHDREELKGMIQMLMAQMIPPPSLADEAVEVGDGQA